MQLPNPMAKKVIDILGAKFTLDKHKVKTFEGQSLPDAALYVLNNKTL